MLFYFTFSWWYVKHHFKYSVYFYWIVFLIWCICVYTRTLNTVRFISVQSSHSVVSDSLRPHELQHTRPPCSSLTPGIYSNSCPVSRWWPLAISSSVVPFSSCLQSFPASGSFLMSQFFASNGQSIGVSPSASILPMNIQDWFPLGLTGWISLQPKGLSRVFSNTTVQKHQLFGAQPSLCSSSHIHTIPCTITQNVPGFQDKVFKAMIKLKYSHSDGL